MSEQMQISADSPLERSWRILVVDDEPDVRHVLDKALSRKFEVVTASTGREVLNGIEHIEPDFVILDVKLPDLDGFQICRRIRSDARFRTTPILFLSALGDNDDIRRGYEVGGNLYLTKPFDPIRLLKNIEVFIERQPPTFLRKRYSLDELDRIDFTKRPGAKRATVRQAPAPDPRPTAEIVEDAFVPVSEPDDDMYDFGVFGQQPVSPQPAQPIPVSRPVAAQPLIPANFHVHDPTKDAPAESMNGALPRLMCIFDDADLLFDIAEACERDFEMTWARDGRTACDRLKDFEPDIIVVDATPLRMTGVQLCKAIRGVPGFEVTPLVFSAARPNLNEKRHLIHAGADSYVKRGIGPKGLARSLREMHQINGAAVRMKHMDIEAALDVIESDEAKATQRALRAPKPRGGQLKTTGAFESFIRQNAPEDDI